VDGWSRRFDQGFELVSAGDPDSGPRVVPIIIGGLSGFVIRLRALGSDEFLTWVGSTRS
jgi:hypothetical protein